MNTGQVTRNSQFGELLYQYAKHERIKTIVDIGTWSGLGTTKCLIDGLIDSNKKDYQLFSIELYPDFHKKATENLQPFLTPNIKLLNGRIIDYEEIFWFDHSTVDFNDPHAALWYKTDLEYLKVVPNVLSLLPEKIDLLILDGGEYSSYPEYKKLKDRTLILALDDTAIFKCKKIREELISENKKFIYDNLTERHGCSIIQL